MEAAQPKRKARILFFLLLYLIFPCQITVVKVTEAPPQRNYVPRSPSPYKNSAAPSPTFRPKAKVNTSATSSLVARKATSVVSSSVVSRTPSVRSAASTRTGTSLTPRSGSPSKQPLPVPRPRAAITRGLTAKVGGQESRRGSLTGSASPSIASSPLLVSEILDLSDDDEPTHSPRITAKLSRRNSSELPPSPPLPPHSSLTGGSLRAQSHRPRVPSISSNASSSSSPFYSASSVASAANPHRFPSARANPPSNAGNYYQPFPRDDPKPYPRVNGFAHATAKVDPTAIPLPPHSPPTSNVSYSSRSSRSPSSVSYANESGTSQLSVPRPGSSGAGDSMRAGLENLMQLSEMLPTAEDGEEDADDSDEDEDEEDQLRASTFERKVRAEAKSVRKVRRPQYTLGAWCVVLTPPRTDRGPGDHEPLAADDQHVARADEAPPGEGDPRAAPQAARVAPHPPAARLPRRRAR